jgi:hypothetical protein
MRYLGIVLLLVCGHLVPTSSVEFSQLKPPEKVPRVTLKSTGDKQIDLSKYPSRGKKKLIVAWLLDLGGG